MDRLAKSGVDIRRLRYFLAVCDHGGFSSAASVTGIAQPALTRQIQLLEQELGLALFTRNGRRAEPTEVGRILMSEVGPALDGLDALLERVRRDHGCQPLQISLGVCPTIARLFREALEVPLRQGGTPIELTVIEAYSGDLRNLLAAGRLDLALSYRPSEAARLRTTALLTERLVLATREVPEGVAAVPLDALARHRLILPSRMHELRRIVDAVAAARGIDLRPALELDSLAAVMAMLDEGAGGYATILPHNAVAGAAQAGRFAICPIDDAGMVRTIALIEPADAPPLPALLTEHIRARAEEIRATHEAIA